jgi:hypothetical protein
MTMRALTISALAMMAAGCATPHHEAACPKPTHDQEYNLIVPTVDRVFGPRHGGYHAIVQSRSTDKRGDLVYRLVEIRSMLSDATEGGDRLTLVADPCSFKLLKTWRPAAS